MCVACCGWGGGAAGGGGGGGGAAPGLGACVYDKGACRCACSPTPCSVTVRRALNDSHTARQVCCYVCVCDVMCDVCSPTHHARTAILDWTSRKKQLAAELLHYRPDIICLQQVRYTTYVVTCAITLAHSVSTIVTSSSPRCTRRATARCTSSARALCIR
jgi:hypothetical protein